MKKLFIVIATVLIFAGCSKESANEFVGTRWETTGFASIMEPIWGYRYHVYEFSEKTVSSYWLDKESKMVNYGGDFEYTIEEPFVTIYHDTDDVRKLEKINKKTMVVTTNSSIKYLMQ